MPTVIEEKPVRFRHLLPSLPPQQVVSVLFRHSWQIVKHRWTTIRARICLWRWGGVAGTRLNAAGYIRCHNYGRLILGNHVTLNSGPDRNYVGGDRRLSLWVGKNAELCIEDKVGISSSTIIAMNSITIREGTLIGGGCDIYDNDFHPVSMEDRQHRKGDIKMAPVIIGPWAFIGAHSIILKGVTIGKGAVVGAGSLVTCNIPDNEIWGGRPARFIKNVPVKSQNKTCYEKNTLVYSNPS
jgi:acetyltransferase-like isoleucine patch superfamily enzyme